MATVHGIFRVFFLLVSLFEIIISDDDDDDDEPRSINFLFVSS